MRVTTAPATAPRGAHHTSFNKGHSLNSVINKVYICHCKMGETSVLIDPGQKARTGARGKRDSLMSPGFRDRPGPATSPLQP